MSSNLPLHPATVHWPFSFLTLSYGLDILQPTWSLLPQAVQSVLPQQAELAKISYYALSIGLLTALPAVFSGVAQAVQIVGKQGLFESDGKTIKPKFKTLITHAISADAVIAASAYTWWYRSASDRVNQGDLVRTGLAVLLGLGMVFAAHNGGSLTYEYGMGLSVGKKSKSL
ncbi:Hypothetical protein D9617_13g101200 [Elsinoe fawcettii]|nr:Hypothetical protein D9617_13g101200 [Elsinoe fawcettii]